MYIPCSTSTRSDMGYDAGEAFSPTSCDDSVTGSEDVGYQTPLTSPDTSPRKARPTIGRLPSLEKDHTQLDGVEEEEAESDDKSDLKTPALEQHFVLTPQRRRPHAVSRHPASLVQHCERHATLRQRRLMTCSIAFPDRLVPSRASTPDKESLLLNKLPRDKSKTARSDKQRRLDSDPFVSAVRHNAISTQRYSALRSPLPPIRTFGLVGTTVRDVTQGTARSASDGTVWTVGGNAVTEGIASTMNGRGGRVTSGTNAPHYNADFLRRHSHNEEQTMHGRRLALAMGLEQGGRMIKRNIHDLQDAVPVRSTVVGSPTKDTRVWRYCKWEKDGISAATKNRSGKVKEIPIIPFRVLDAPSLRDDYYCSLLAYSSTMQCLAVGLASHVYLWSEARGTTQTSIPTTLSSAHSSHVTSLSFSSSPGASSILAIGRANGRITLWSPLDVEPRFDSEQPAPVSCLCFRPTTSRKQSVRDSNVNIDVETLLVGDETGSVYVYSIEWPSHDQRDLFNWHGSMTLLAKIACHSQQVCSIAWSADGEYFATGGNDNQLYLFEARKFLNGAVSTGATRLSTIQVRAGLTQRPVMGQGTVLTVLPGQEKQVFALNAAVKALAFAPWQSSLLAAGGGSNDRCIHFFHTLSGASLATIDCYAQVTSLVWNDKRSEIAATLGFAQPEHPYRVAVFAWPSCDMLVSIPWWGEERALFAVPYPRGPVGRKPGDLGCLVIATSDASIKFHEIWPKRASTSKKAAGEIRSPVLEDTCSVEMEEKANIR